MATKHGIQQLLETLELAGLMTERKGAPRLRSREDRERLAGFWSALLVDVSDEQLQAGVAGFLRDPAACQWYPQPGTILLHVPGAKLPPRTPFERAMAEIDRQISEEEAHGIETGNPGGDPTTPERRLLQ